MLFKNDKYVVNMVKLLKISKKLDLSWDMGYINDKLDDKTMRLVLRKDNKVIFNKIGDGTKLSEKVLFFIRNM